MLLMKSIFFIMFCQDKKQNDKICISVQILAEEAANLEDLDLSAAKEQLSLAVSQAASGGGDEVAVAKAQIAQEVAEQVIKAAESA